MRIIIIALLAFLNPSFSYSQHNFFAFKKKDKIVSVFHNNSFIAFQLSNKEWVAGHISNIKNDSFYLKPLIVLYSWAGADTLHYPLRKYAIADIAAMPKKGFLIDYRSKEFGISGVGGHVHWYWVKSGWLFRTVGLGYIGLHLINGLSKKPFAVSGKNISIAAGAILLGFILKQTYSHTLPIGKKYHFTYIKVDD